MLEEAQDLNKSESKKRTRILDIGIGQGGQYLLSQTEQAKVFAVDVRESTLQSAKTDYPAVQSTLASVENLPFAEQSFDQVQIFFPAGQLLMGLRGEAEKPEGWFPELARVLEKEGKLIVYGDNLAHVRKIAEQAAPLFELSEPISNLSVSELRETGTKQAFAVAREISLNKEHGYQAIAQKLVLKRI